mmetsp:Transcript_9854/g.44886  ORF Transcript_9854/g.44886 Transcript_9854/m.44886 type:complete len:271 (-) Transcript_9854:2265-3077(-)
MHGCVPRDRAGVVHDPGARRREGHRRHAAAGGNEERRGVSGESDASLASAGDRRGDALLPRRPRLLLSVRLRRLRVPGFRRAVLPVRDERRRRSAGPDLQPRFVPDRLRPRDHSRHRAHRRGSDNLPEQGESREGCVPFPHVRRLLHLYLSAVPPARELKVHQRWTRGSHTGILPAEICILRVERSADSRRVQKRRRIQQASQTLGFHLLSRVHDLPLGAVPVRAARAAGLRVHRQFTGPVRLAQAREHKPRAVPSQRAQRHLPSVPPLR